MGFYNLSRMADTLMERRKQQTPKCNSKKENYQHICAIFKKTPTKPCIVGIGYNHYPNKNKLLLGTVHAEIDAIRKNLNKIKNDRVSIFVGRVKGGNSRPCSHCIHSMIDNMHIRIKNVYYTNGGGDIACESFNQLTSNCDQHMSMYYRSLSNGSLFGSDDEDDDDEAKLGSEAQGIT